MYDRLFERDVERYAREESRKYRGHNQILDEIAYMIDSAEEDIDYGLSPYGEKLLEHLVSKLEYMLHIRRIPESRADDARAAIKRYKDYKIRHMFAPR